MPAGPGSVTSRRDVPVLSAQRFQSRGDGGKQAFPGEIPFGHGRREQVPRPGERDVEQSVQLREILRLFGRCPLDQIPRNDARPEVTGVEPPLGVHDSARPPVPLEGSVAEDHDRELKSLCGVGGHDPDAAHVLIDGVRRSGVRVLRFGGKVLDERPEREAAASLEGARRLGEPP